jgi:DAK2 domain fusion protein YloV
MDLNPKNAPLELGGRKPEKLILDGQGLKLLTWAGLCWLRTNQQTVNALNVFPVPDGDTGTNMVLTMQAAYDEVAKSAEMNAGKIAHSIAHGALMGARGNSGVILSQLWRGFARALDNLEVLDGPNLVKALALGRDTAYKGVVRPVEGTILTVAKDAASAAEDALLETQDVFEILARVVPAADQSVKRTPDLLLVLKEAGVVDSGGKGLFYILEGMLRYYNGQTLEVASTTLQPLAAMKFENTIESIEPGQDIEVVIDFRPKSPLDLERFYHDLEEIGTSIQVGEGDGFYRLHIHVPNEKRYAPIDYAMTLGVMTKVNIENLAAQMEDVQHQGDEEQLTYVPLEIGQIGVIAVAPGPGIARAFASLGVSAVIEGGQTMNPSTKEIIGAFENLPTDRVVILPNNKNIILAAKSAEKLTVKKLGVVPSESVPQGIAALMRFVPDGDFDKVVADMTSALSEVQTGEITTATRSVEIDGVEVKEGQIIALLNGKLILSAASLEDACLNLLHIAQADNHNLITIFYGVNVSVTEAEAIAEKIRMAYPHQELEVKEGGQPHYHFIISIED